MDNSYKQYRTYSTKSPIKFVNSFSSTMTYGNNALGRVQSLITRNEQLIQQISKIKQENQELKEINRSLNNRYLLKHKLQNDKSTQTDDQCIESTILVESFERVDITSATREKNEDTSIFEYCTPRKGFDDFISIDEVKRSPAQERVLKVLSDNCKISSNRSDFRSKREVRRPISYKEPNLHAKVRKGFKFFKFQDENKPN